jgi:carbonic anhydrase
MKATIKIISVLFVCIVFAYNHVLKDVNLQHTEDLHWSYQGETAPEYWSEIERNSDCNGQRQSPINIIHDDATRAGISDDLEILYSPSTKLNQVENNGHSIQFDFDKGDSIRYHNSTYYLQQVHFHEPSEHKINGVVYPIEIHLVHMNVRGNLTVLSVLGEEGSESQLFEFFESFLPLENGETKAIHKAVDISSLFQDPDNYYTYGGSLTTPPCTENVNWIVFKTPMILSVEEVKILRKNMPLNNFRNEQELNSRVVHYHQ